MSDVMLFRSALRDQLRAKRLIVALLVVALPAVVAMLWRHALENHHQAVDAKLLYNALSSGLVFGFGLVILSVVFATGAVSQEMEQKTIVYLLTRPVPRWRILLMKFLPALLAVVLASWLAAIALVLCTYGARGLDAGVFRRDMLVLPVGALAYGALFLFLATLISRPLLWGLLFSFGWEFWVPNLPGSFKKGSVMAYLRVLSPHAVPEAETKDISDIFSALSPTTITAHLAWEVLAGVIVVGLLAALFVFSQREYVPRDDAE